MSVEVSANKTRVKPEQLTSWEAGAARPSIPQLRRLALAYRRPLAAFYLPEPPRKFQLMHDFRRIQNRDEVENSPELVYEIRRAYDRREWALDLMADLEERPRVFNARASTKDDEEEVATLLRKAIGVTLESQSSWHVGTEAFREWRVLLENSGLLTLQATSLQLDEARGFSISLKPLPVIAVNIKDAPRGRIFTLLHEATHVMLNEGGICDLHDADIEAYCNRVAGAALFPREALLNTLTVRRHRKGDSTWTDLELQDISREFGGSREAVLVRLLTLGLTTQHFYHQMRPVFLREYAALQKKKEEQQGFAPPHVIAISSAGPLFTNLVIQNFNRDNITASDVSDYLQVRVKHLSELQAEVSKRER